MADHDEHPDILDEPTSVDDGFIDPEAVEDDTRDSSLSLFEGDDGELPLDVRQCLVGLIRTPLITRDRHPRAWETLVRNRRILRSRLNDLFLDLVMDAERGVAYKVQVRSEVPRRFPTLLRDTAYTREETVLMVHLRQRHLAESTGSGRVWVDRQDCIDAVARYRPPSATDVYGDESRTRNAIENLRAMGILERTAEEDRLVISPVIETLLPIGRLKELLAWLQRQNDPTPDEPEPEPSLIDLTPDQAAAIEAARAAEAADDEDDLDADLPEEDRDE